MDEIRRLQAELSALQTKPSVHRLSERNMIEIISKLKERGLITLFHTTNGKEFLTQKQIEREVSDQLYLAGNRSTISEIAAIIDIDILRVQDAATRLARKGVKYIYIKKLIFISSFTLLKKKKYIQFTLGGSSADWDGPFWEPVS